mgnify:CR=1 FL=1
MTTQQPEALAQECADYATSLRSGANVANLKGRAPSVSFLRAADLFERAASRITELESQLAQRFDAADVATASAQGFRDGVASLSANAGEPRNAIDRDALIDAIAQGLHGTWHCTRVWEAWHVGTMSQDDFEPVDESETPTEIADAVLALLAATPTAQQGAAYAALPEYGINTASHAHFRVLGFTADQMRAFADATYALRAPHWQASSQADEYPALVCDYCGALTPDPWHSSGMLHGKMSKHIHSCDACAAQGAAQAQDTPAYSPAQSDL